MRFSIVLNPLIVVLLVVPLNCFGADTSPGPNSQIDRVLSMCVNLKDVNCKTYLMNEVGKLYLKKGDTNSAIKVAHLLNELDHSDNRPLLAFMQSCKTASQIEDGEKIASLFPVNSKNQADLVLFQNSLVLGAKQAEEFAQKISDDSAERIEADIILVSLISQSESRKNAFAKLIQKYKILPFSSRNAALFSIANAQARSGDVKGALETSQLLPNIDDNGRFQSVASVLDISNADSARLIEEIDKINAQAKEFPLLERASAKVGTDRLVGILVNRYLTISDYEAAAKSAETYHGTETSAIELATYKALNNNLADSFRWLELSQFRKVEIAVRVAVNCHRSGQDASATAFFAKALEIANGSNGDSRSHEFCLIGMGELEVGGFDVAESCLQNVDKRWHERWELLTELARKKAIRDPKQAADWASAMTNPEDFAAAAVGLIGGQ